MNLLTSNLQCIECNCTKLIKDYTRQEIYCSNCGLILMDTSLPVIADLENITNEEQTKEDYYKLRRFLSDMDLMRDTFSFHNQVK